MDGRMSRPAAAPLWRAVTLLAARPGAAARPRWHRGQRRGDAFPVRSRCELECAFDLSTVEAIVVLELIEHLHVLAKNGNEQAEKREHPTRRHLQAVRSTR